MCSPLQPRYRLCPHSAALLPSCPRPSAGLFATAPAAASSVALPFDFSTRLLYLLALSLAMVLGLLYVTGHASRLKFDMASWSLAFPLEALAIATLMYAAAVPGQLTSGARGRRAGGRRPAGSKCVGVGEG